MNELVGLIYNSEASLWLRMTSWVIPLLQTLHLLGLAALMGSAILLNMRLAGLLAWVDSAEVIVSRYQRVLYIALIAMLISGLILILGEPERILPKDIFWIKMGLVTVGLLATIATIAALLRQGREHKPRPADQALAWAGLLVWTVTIFCGRFIAYIY